MDDVVAYRFSPERIFICVNSSNREKDFAWMSEHAQGVKPVDRSDDYAQIAVQGPKAAGLVQRLTKADLSKVGTYRFTEGEVAGVKCIISRTGYTGEDGFELYCAADDAREAVERAAAGGPGGRREARAAWAPATACARR